MAWVRDHLPPVRPADGQQVARLLRDLDDDKFAVREAAEAGLNRLAEAAAPALRQALDGKPSSEVRQRLTRVLEHLAREDTPEHRRSVRAIEVLERLGTPEARQVLGELVQGAAAARRTREAKASLDRLARRGR